MSTSTLPQYHPIQELTELLIPSIQLEVLTRSIQDLWATEVQILNELASIERQTADIRLQILKGWHLHSPISQDLARLAEKRDNLISQIKMLAAVITDLMDDEDAPFYQPERGTQVRDVIYRLAFERKEDEQS